MKLEDLFGKKNKKTVIETTVKTTVEVEEVKAVETKEKDSLNKVAPKDIGVLDMVIAFDTTGSMAAYIDAVRKEVADLVPRLFKDNENLRLGIVAFGDYCDMVSATEFGDAYQCLMPTDNENDIIKFIRESHDTNGGDGDEFYELVIKKIVEETPWRDDATKAILLISDAEPHPLGYTYEDFVVGNQIDWRKELSRMTNGVSVPFESGHKTARLVEAATMSRGSVTSRMKFDMLAEECKDEELAAVYHSYRKEREDV